MVWLYNKPPPAPPAPPIPEGFTMQLGPRQYPPRPGSRADKQQKMHVARARALAILEASGKPEGPKNVVTNFCKRATVLTFSFIVNLALALGIGFLLGTIFMIVYFKNFGG